MNKIAIIAGLCGFAAGATGGYCVCHFIDKAKIDKAISDGVQQALDEIRGNQKQKVMDNENKKSEMIKTTGRNIHSIDGVALVKDIVNDSGYSVEEDVKEPEGEPDDDDSDLPFEIPVEKHNIWDEEDEDEEILTQEEYDQKQEPEIPLDISKLDPSTPPYPITDDQYNNEFQDETGEGLWDKVTLIFFKDNVFAERVRMDEFTSMSNSEIEIAIGKDNMKKFIEDRSLGRIFVRNNKLHIDYEIVRSPRSYSSALHEDDEE